jgi:hypothetical protein
MFTPTFKVRAACVVVDSSRDSRRFKQRTRQTPVSSSLPSLSMQFQEALAQAMQRGHGSELQQSLMEREER